MSQSIRSSSLPILGLHGFQRLAYTESGEANNPDVLVCAHGLTRNAHDFDLLAQALAPRRRVACVDMPGRGRSDWLPLKADYNYQLYNAAAAALIARLGVERLDWLGTSMGGLIGLVLAAQPNTPIRRLILNDVGPFVPKDALIRIGQYVSLDPRFTSLEEAEAYLRKVQFGFGAMPDSAWRDMAVNCTRAVEGGFAMHYDPGIGEVFTQGEILDVNLWPLWGMVRCPVLVLRGVDSDLLLPETARMMAETGPRAHVVEIPGCGHAPSLMTEAQIAIVAEWLDRAPIP